MPEPPVQAFEQAPDRRPGTILAVGDRFQALGRGLRNLHPAGQMRPVQNRPLLDPGLHQVSAATEKTMSPCAGRSTRNAIG